MALQDRCDKLIKTLTLIIAAISHRQSLLLSLKVKCFAETLKYVVKCE